MASVLAVAGCGKSQQGQSSQGMEINGVKVDLPKLRDLVNQKPDQRDSINTAVSAIRYGKYDDGLADLEKLAADPSFTDAQKKLIADVIEQVKQVKAKAPASPAP